MWKCWKIIFILIVYSRLLVYRPRVIEEWGCLYIRVEKICYDRTLIGKLLSLKWTWAVHSILRSLSNGCKKLYLYNMAELECLLSYKPIGIYANSIREMTVKPNLMMYSSWQRSVKLYFLRLYFDTLAEYKERYNL